MVRSHTISLLPNLVMWSCTDLLCNDGDIRLVGGASDHEGTVQICMSEAWGTVCDDMWNNLGAQVLCRQLGFSTRSKSQHSSLLCFVCCCFFNCLLFCLLFLFCFVCCFLFVVTFCRLGFCYCCLVVVTRMLNYCYCTNHLRRCC